MSKGPRARAPAAPRFVFYSHDTFGLGHLRRSRALATQLTRAYPGSSAVILTGSPVAGRFTFDEGIDYIRLPGVTKLVDGSYASQSMRLDIDEVTRIRAELIRSAIDAIQPDVLVVDKEPTGFRGELLPALEALQGTQTRIVLGLRDVLDDPATLADEWERKAAIPAAEAFYDEVWIYGLKDIYDPTQGLSLSDDLRARMHWTGYLRREAPAPAQTRAPFFLVTPGGGGDGAHMVDLVLSAYEACPSIETPAELVYGPFLAGERRAEFEARVAALDGRVSSVGFESQIEALFMAARGVVCMGGYNTFCEVLSFDKRAVIVPRTVPRREQHIRAKRGEALGLVRMLDEDAGDLTPAAMAAALKALPAQPLPSQAPRTEGLLDGLDVVTARTQALLGA